MQYRLQYSIATLESGYVRRSSYEAKRTRLVNDSFTRGSSYNARRGSARNG